MKKILYLSKGLLILAVSLMFVSCHTKSYYNCKKALDAWEEQNNKAQNLYDLQLSYSGVIDNYIDGCNPDEQCTIRARISSIESLIRMKAESLAQGTYLIKNEATGAEICKLELAGGGQAKIFRNDVLVKSAKWYTNMKLNLLLWGSSFKICIKSDEAKRHLENDIEMAILNESRKCTAVSGWYVKDISGTYHGVYEKIK